MAAKKYMTSLAGKKLLVAPLDWGLGHATRCVPIIRDLLDNDCKVWLAGEGAQEKILREEFPSLPFLPLKGYRINYSKRALAAQMFLQIPSILRSINREHLWLMQQVKEYKFDAVIADNRYGLYHEKVYSIIITHQLRIKSSLGKWSENMLQQWNYRLINRFNECWIPDDEGTDNLAGDLSHPKVFPAIPVHFIGPLTRFQSGTTEEKRDHLLVILSGPEPQRTIFENKIIEEVVGYSGTATIVRGLPEERNIIPSTNFIQFYNHLSSKQLNVEMMKAEFIIGRSGYSSIMDMAGLKKKSILIPTPGQTEQEYLGAHLMEKQLAFCVSQKKFSLLSNLKDAKEFFSRSGAAFGEK